MGTPHLYMYLTTIEPRGVQKSIHAESKPENEAMVTNNHNLVWFFRSMHINILPSTSHINLYSHFSL